MKILLAVDGSKASLDAVDWVIAHGEWLREKPSLELVTVHLPLPRLPRMRVVISKSQIAQYYAEEGEASLAPAKKKLDAARVPYAARVLVGPIAETIVKHARETRCDLICVGSRGMGALGKALLGSTATKLAQLSPLPLLIAKQA
jgi:nucleotide-binding universal stress UspA family protein